MAKTLNINEILDILPHRYPFLLIDRVIELSDDLTHVVAIKNVTVNEPQFTGHFPGAPVMPGVLMIEAMAQTCGILAISRLPEGTDKKNGLFYFAGIDKARFKRIVQPGDQLVITGHYIRSKLGMGIFEADIKVDGKSVCSAQMMCAYRPVPQKTSAIADVRAETAAAKAE